MGVQVAASVQQPESRAVFPDREEGRTRMARPAQLVSVIVASHSCTRKTRPVENKETAGKKKVEKVKEDKDQKVKVEDKEVH